MAKAKYQLGEDRSHVNAEGHAQMVGPSSGASLDIRRKAGNVSRSDFARLKRFAENLAHTPRVVLTLIISQAGLQEFFLAWRFLVDNAVFCLVKSIVWQNKRIWRRPFPPK